MAITHEELFDIIKRHQKVLEEHQRLIKEIGKALDLITQMEKNRNIQLGGTDNG